MKSNYQPWGVDFSEFNAKGSKNDKLRFLMRFAVLAPSSHNSQPWSFEVGQNEIVVKPDMSRALFESDKNLRQLFISLGSAIENIVIAADYFGYSPRVLYSADSARIIFTEAPQKNDEKHLVKYIPMRRTNRTRYDSRVPDEFLRKLKEDQNMSGLHIVTSKEKKDMIADAVLDSMEAAMDDDGFRRELSNYVKNNLTFSPVGMPAFGMGIPTPLSFIAPFILRKVNMARKSRGQDEELLKTHTPAYIVIATREDAPPAWMEAGRTYERAALLGTKYGIATAPMAAVIQIGDFYKRVQETLGISDRPQFFARVGYPEKDVAHSPRLNAEKVIIQ